MEEAPGAHCADIIEWDAIASVCPREAADLLAVLQGIHVSDMATALATEEPEWWTEEMTGERRDAIRAAWGQLQVAFEKKTKVRHSCLRLRRGHHNPDYGGLHDEIAYGFFYLEGCYELSPAGKKFQALFKRLTWVRND